MNDEEECKDIMQDTREKCMEDYGSVVSVLCARAGTECPAERVGQVFVRFGDVGTAIRAAQGLHNVKFDGRVVEVCLSVFVPLAAHTPRQKSRAQAFVKFVLFRVGVLTTPTSEREVLLQTRGSGNFARNIPHQARLSQKSLQFSFEFAVAGQGHLLLTGSDFARARVVTKFLCENRVTQRFAQR